MKHTITLLLFSTLLMSNSFSQFKRHESIKMYDLKIKAEDVTSSSQFTGSGLSYYETTLLDDPQVVKISNDYLEDLGTYRKNYKNYREGSNPLFNLSSDRNYYPLLDTIDMDFYRNVGLDKLVKRNNSIVNDTNFLKLRGVIIDSLTWSTKKKKDYLFTKQFDSIRNQLITTRFDTTNHQFTIDKKKVNLSTVKLKASLDSIVLNSTIQGKAELYAYVHNLADENVKVIGYYYDAQFDPKYIAKIQYFLETIQVYNTQLDQFAFWLKKYIDTDIVAANTELVAIQVTGSYDKTKVNADSISLDLNAKFQIPKQEADKISVALSVAFSKNQTVTVSTSFNSVFILRYFTSKNVDDLVFKPLKTNNALISKFQ